MTTQDNNLPKTPTVDQAGTLTIDGLRDGVRGVFTRIESDYECIIGRKPGDLFGALLVGLHDYLEKADVLDTQETRDCLSSLSEETKIPEEQKAIDLFLYVLNPVPRNKPIQFSVMY